MPRPNAKVSGPSPALEGKSCHLAGVPFDGTPKMCVLVFFFSLKPTRSKCTDSGNDEAPNHRCPFRLEIDGYPWWMIKPPGEPGIAIYFSTQRHRYRWPQKEETGQGQVDWHYPGQGQVGTQRLPKLLALTQLHSLLLGKVATRTSGLTEPLNPGCWPLVPTC